MATCYYQRPLWLVSSWKYEEYSTMRGATHAQSLLGIEHSLRDLLVCGGYTMDLHYNGDR